MLEFSSLDCEFVCSVSTVDSASTSKSDATKNDSTAEEQNRRTRVAGVDNSGRLGKGPFN